MIDVHSLLAIEARRAHAGMIFTHGAAWTSTSIAGLMKVLDEVRKAGPQPGQVAATKHEDYLMQTTMYLAGSGSGTPAYLRVVPECEARQAGRVHRGAQEVPVADG